MIHAVIGTSGSGKSTLISALLGLHRPQEGAIVAQLNDERPITLGDDLSLNDWILNVGYLSQQPFLFQGTVRDNLTLRVSGATLNEELVNSLIQKLQLDDCLGAQPLEFVLHEGSQFERRPTTTPCSVACASNQEASPHPWMKRRAPWTANCVPSFLTFFGSGLSRRLQCHSVTRQRIGATCDDVLDLGNTQGSNWFHECARPSHCLLLLELCRIFFLCLRKLLGQHPRWLLWTSCTGPVHPEAPFQFGSTAHHYASPQKRITTAQA